MNKQNKKGKITVTLAKEEINRMENNKKERLIYENKLILNSRENLEKSLFNIKYE